MTAETALGMSGSSSGVRGGGVYTAPDVSVAQAESHRQNLDGGGGRDGPAGDAGRGDDLFRTAHGPAVAAARRAVDRGDSTRGISARGCINGRRRYPSHDGAWTRRRWRPFLTAEIGRHNVLVPPVGVGHTHDARRKSASDEAS